MIKEAMQYILSLGTIEKHIVEKQIYSDKPLHLVAQATPKTLVVRNLGGLVDYLRSNYDEQPPVLIQVESPTEVKVYSTFNRDMQRNHLLTAEAMPPKIPFRQFIDAEEFNILLQSCFVDSPGRAALLRIIGNIKEDAVRTVGDNGISQEVTVKTGVATVEAMPVPNPVLLKPYRTFVEVFQPESEFVFRMQKGPTAALFEADGGEWKLKAIHNIREHLDKELADQIASKQVTIIS